MQGGEGKRTRGEKGYRAKGERRTGGEGGRVNFWMNHNVNTNNERFLGVNLRGNTFSRNEF